VDKAGSYFSAKNKGIELVKKAAQIKEEIGYAYNIYFH